MSSSSTGIYLAIAGAAVLAAAGGAAFWYASQKNAGSPGTADQLVTVNATTCAPNAITVPGGRRSFEIVNASDRPIEWEILDGVMVVAERENIAPGFRATLEVQLQPGDYAITCGLLSNPRGTLTVTASDEASAAASEVTLRKFLGPLSEYRVYLVMQGNAAVKSAEALREAIAAGDLDAARAAWRQARLPYRRIEPLAYRFSDLEERIDPRAAYLEKREQDPAFTGYHRLEYGLFAQDSTDGLLPVADALVADLKELAQRLKQAPLDPGLLIEMPGESALQMAQAQVPEGENLYAGNDLQDFGASLEGIGKLAGLLRQVVAGVDPALDKVIDQDLQAVDARLAALRDRGFAGYGDVPRPEREQLSADLNRLSETLRKLQPAIGIN
ncbi:Iron uptake system EfeUOB, component EfeO/EfeM [Paracoccus aminovorans]|uniref:Iron uptake system EfeUOB, component EfeO/EfeM n=1 Tax=Paracoccus aminovorans TaxID=34004 RepID=A0A1I2XBK3_9RHOB|nr:iron uptake system protein EfeO [Paracoccus aminovorans]CQR85553.1 iron transport periplasmic lipoprotein [Paracoccus aminovorans]SFH09381.1 Iron uptake system EfeUOB, component EfeO/EfeM [Paracoccus aminovorans]